MLQQLFFCQVSIASPRKTRDLVLAMTCAFLAAAKVVIVAQPKVVQPVAHPALTSRAIAKNARTAIICQLISKRCV